jgi:transposase
LAQIEANVAVNDCERFGNQGMRGRKVGIVALARKLAIALWRFVENDIVPEGATLKIQHCN